MEVNAAFPSRAVVLRLADVELEGVSAVALITRLRHVEEFAKLTKELLADGLLGSSHALPVRYEVSNVPFRHGRKFRVGSIGRANTGKESVAKDRFFRANRTHWSRKRQP